MFGGGAYSVAGSAQLRMVGKRKWPVAEIAIQQPKGATRSQKGVIMRQRTPPFLPKSIREPYHPGGNSLCYMIQTAHLMGCNPIYCLGFTLMSGTGYFFGLENPATGKRTFYSDPDRALEWISWYQSQHPGRARLWPGWSGPIYDVLEVAGDGEAQRQNEGVVRPRHEPEANHRNDAREERLRPARQAQQVRRDVQQPVPRKEKPKRRPKGRVIGG